MSSHLLKARAVASALEQAGAQMLAPRAFLVSILIASSIVALHAGAAAQQLGKATIVQMHPVIGPGEDIFIYAVPKQLGYFKAEGLDVSIQGAQSGVVSAQVLQSGGAQIGTTAPESVLQMREQGGDLVAFWQIKQNGGTFLVVLPDSPIKRIEDLKGKTVGAPSFGAAGGMALKANLRDIGITPDQYTALSIGAGPAAFAALQNKQVDALVTWDAMLGAAENTGMALRNISIPLQDSLAGMTMATSESFAKSSPKALEGLCRSIAKGLHFAMTSREAAVRVFWREFPTAQPANVDAAAALKNHAHVLDRFLEKAMQGVPYGGKTGEFVPAMWKNSQANYQANGALKGTVAPDAGYTTQFLEACNAFDRNAVAADAKKY
jgi:NitT/TauT family transport system substrate-binding protein